MVRTGFTTNIYSRDAASGRPTGKRSGEAGSGMATGRRQYSPVFSEEGSIICNSCDVAVATNPLYEQTGNTAENPLYESSNKTVVNPLYQPSGNGGVNPMSENKSIQGNTEEGSDGVAAIDVLLLKAENGAVVAKTKTEASGDFWFAHVPEGNYIVKVSGSVISKKQYDITINKGAKDVAGELLSAADSWVLQFSVEPDSIAETSRIIKSKSNVKNNRSAYFSKKGYDYYKALRVTNSDEDGDGRSESLVGGLLPGGAVISSAASARINKSKSNVKNNRMIADTDNDADESSASLVGASLPGGAVISSAFTAIGPIKGVIVKGGRNPGSDVSRTSITNEFGEFEFTNMESGTYFIRTEHLIVIDDETLINTINEGSQQRAQDHNSSRSNKTSYAVNDGDAEQRAQDHNSSRSNKTSSLADMGKDRTPEQRAQNNNTVRSNRGEFKSVIIEADTDGDGDFETDISNAYAYTLVTDEKGNYGDAQQKAGISTSRSNIRNKSSLKDIGNDLYIVYGSATINGKTFETKSVLKTRHDTAKNSVGNIR